jgi:hypothetical protein
MMIYSECLLSLRLCDNAQRNTNCYPSKKDLREHNIEDNPRFRAYPFCLKHGDFPCWCFNNPQNVSWGISTVPGWIPFAAFIDFVSELLQHSFGILVPVKPSCLVVSTCFNIVEPIEIISNICCLTMSAKFDDHPACLENKKKQLLETTSHRNDAFASCQRHWATSSSLSCRGRAVLTKPLEMPPGGM